MDASYWAGAWTPCGFRRRSVSVWLAPAAGGVSTAGAMAPLDGIVRRSDGHQTVWINGEAHSGSLPHIKIGVRSIRLLAAPDKTVEIAVGGPSAFTNGAEP